MKEQSTNVGFTLNRTDLCILALSKPLLYLHLVIVRADLMSTPERHKEAKKVQRKAPKGIKNRSADT